MTVGERIKMRRLELELTQEELAKRLGYTSRTAISNVEKGKEDLTTTRVRKFAEALGVTPAYLMGWEDTPSDDLVKLASTYEKGVDYSVEIDNRLYLTIEMEKHNTDMINRLLKYVSLLNEAGLNDLIRYARLISHDEEYVLKEGDTDEKT